MEFPPDLDSNDDLGITNTISLNPKDDLNIKTSSKKTTTKISTVKAEEEEESLMSIMLKTGMKARKEEQKLQELFV